ncbi:MAG: RlmE family RNA methyltransferase [Deltaproteobacteria bacterium CG_4_10_14_0_2_um_filter_43_8]|nr:MAG: cell division protein FtsJ [Deltaproteobacteria bacterium CG11_big_fil_rev_8_21_14_0_20_42_23]PJA22151.1 MAG: RlmE family RNA methyltransferase [Deltaproteobacteria bacterium CG_4_10_14_0_2_um_filter_43_8]PJC65133.1 MAG: RlmE family RNA methyltransferase [Deltaproteobacteria bacterium CG_4_9_14_0_2_um_filter_42_21]
MAYNRKDHYYKKAKAEGKASRASYKIIQLQERFQFLRKGDKVIDLGCAPGGWLQELAQIVGPQGKVVGIDILPVEISFPKYVEIFLASIEDEATPALLEEHLGGKAKAIVSDMAPNTTGVAFADAYKSYELCLMGFELCAELLQEGGTYICKMFPGAESQGFRKTLQAAFQKVSTVTPPATRKTSSEFYLVCQGFKESEG